MKRIRKINYHDLLRSDINDPIILGKNIDYYELRDKKIEKKSDIYSMLTKMFLWDYEKYRRKTAEKILAILERRCEKVRHEVRYIPSINTEIRLDYVDNDINMEKIQMEFYKDGKYILNFKMNDNTILAKPFKLVFNVLYLQRAHPKMVDEKEYIEKLKEIEEKYNYYAGIESDYLWIQ